MSGSLKRSSPISFLITLYLCAIVVCVCWNLSSSTTSPFPSYLCVHVCLMEVELLLQSFCTSFVQPNKETQQIHARGSFCVCVCVSVCARLPELKIQKSALPLSAHQLLAPTLNTPIHLPSPGGVVCVVCVWCVYPPLCLLPQPSALRTAASVTVTASHPVSVSVVWDGRGHPAASVCITQDACMGPAHSRGSVCVRRAGEASFVTRTSTTAQTTNPVLMAPPAPTPDRAVTLAPAGQDMGAQTVSWRLTSVTATPARMVAVAT